MRDIFNGVAFLIAVFVIGAVIVSGGSHLGRWGSKFGEETRRQTFEESVAYNQGSVLDLSNLCRQYKTAEDDAERAAIADTIRLRSDAYTGELPISVQECLNEVR